MSSIDLYHPMSSSQIFCKKSGDQSVIKYNNIINQYDIVITDGHSDRKGSL